MRFPSKYLPLLSLLIGLSAFAPAPTALAQLRWWDSGANLSCDAVYPTYTVVVEDDETPSGSYSVPIYLNSGHWDTVTFTVNDDRSVSSLSYRQGPIDCISDSTITASTDGKLYTSGGLIAGTVDAGINNSLWSRSWKQVPWIGISPPYGIGYGINSVLRIRAKCRCETCSPGMVTAGLHSLDVQVGLGASTDGQTSGALQISAQLPLAALSSPQLLLRPAMAGATVITDANGLRQVLTGQVFADVVTNNQFQYQILLYQSSDAGTLGGDGLYHPTTSPFKTVTIQNPDASSTIYNRLWVTEQEGSSSNLFAYSYDSTSSAWQLLAPGNLQKKVLTTIYSTDNSMRIDLLSVYNPGTPDVLAYQEQDRYQDLGAGLVLVEQILDPAGLKLTNTWDYFSNNLLKQKSQWDGYWETYLYDAQQRETNRTCAFRSPTNGSPDALCRTLSTSYSTSPPNITTIERVLGQEVSRTYTALYTSSNCVTVYRCQSPGAAWNDPANLVSFTVRNSASQPLISRQADGTATFYRYVTNGDNSITTTSTNGVINSAGNGISEGTKTIQVTGPFGEMVSNIVMNFTGGAESALLVLDSYSYGSTDYARTSPTISHLDGTQTVEANGCCGTPNLGNTVDRDGTTTYYLYDALKRKVSSTVNGIISSNIFDSYGNAVSSMRIGTDASVITNRQSVFDLAGRLTSETNALHSGTTYSYSVDSQGQLVKTATFQDGTTRIETHFRDGSLRSVTGTGVFPVQWDYGADSNGTFTLEIKLDANGGTNEWTKTYTDMLGRQYLTIYSSASNSAVSISYFNSKGQLTNQIDPDGVSSLYTYNGKGERACTVLDWNQDHVIDLSGSDRITFTTNDVVSDHATNVKRTQIYAWGQTGVPSSNLVSTTETSTDGLRYWNTIWNGGVGISSQSVTVYAGGGNRYQTNFAPDSSYTVSAFQYGRLTSVTRYDANASQIGQTTYGYDAHGRQNTVTDARTGTTTYFFNDADQVSGVVTPAPSSGQSAQATTNFFDAMGHLIATTLPDNTSVTNVFNAQGLLALTYGSRVYPVGYAYDAQGRMLYMTNWSDFSGHNGSRVTGWNYDPYRGFLAGKSYDNGNSAGPTYSYTSGGRLLSRVWARGITTSYAYTPAGELATVTYSDGSTPSVSYGYDRRGRQTSITNGSSICTLVLNDAGNVLIEGYSGTGPLTGISVTNRYDTLLRRTRNATLVNGALLTLVDEAYDAASRPLSISDGINTALYGYIANSPQVGQISFSNYATLRMVTTKSFDNLNRLVSIATTNALGTALDSHAYAYNSANQRTAVTTLDNSFWVYQYDSLGQVTSGVKYWSDGTPVAGQQFGYVFDSIGNRQSTAAGGDQAGANLRSASYTANNLNQYSSRTVPGAADIIGSATNAATVTVNGQSTYRHYDYYRAELAIDNSTGPMFQSVSNLAVLTVDTNTVSTNIIGNVFLPQTPEAFTHDADGNLTSDGRWTYFWDAENRLIGMTNNAGVPDAAKMTLSFAYDYLGRRVRKTVSAYDSLTLSYQISLQNTFVYDGWNLQAELNATNNAVVRSYVWGLDLSGTLQGAGGVGGLLWTYHPQLGNARAFACFDGNGNVSTMVYCPDATIVGQYEYGPFGEVTRAIGPMAKANPFRFSTTYHDETDLLYYGYRYYHANAGRWISRDPIEERGGLNIFGFVDNSPCQASDALGLDGNPIMGLGGAWNSDPYGAAGSFYGPGASAWNQNPSAWSYGAQWGVGIAPNLTLAQNDSWTVDMQRSFVMSIDRKRMRDELTEYCSRVLPPPLRIELGRELGDIPAWLYPMVFASDLMYNPTAAFIGSWTGGDMTATDIDCCSHRAKVHIHAFNITGTASLSHKPPKDGRYGSHLLPDNLFGYDGPMHSVTQTFDWDEYIFF